ncbi:MAG: TetR/AcrR family transcriptional regulator [Phycisphaerales bacterium]|nr:MAG: TetR/AcrR family transcriptional regulator [Phycisphaerales bacterium]
MTHAIESIPSVEVVKGPTRKAAQRLRTRAELLAAARAMFAERGYAATGTEDLVSAAGVTRGALYYQFADKADVFGAVVAELRSELVARVRARGEAAKTPWARLVGECHAYLDLCEDPVVRQILLLDAPAVFGWAKWREDDLCYQCLRQSVQAVIDAGELKPIPAETTTFLLMGALDQGAMCIARSADKVGARRAVGEALETLLTHGLRA